MNSKYIFLGAVVFFLLLGVGAILFLTKNKAGPQNVPVVSEQESLPKMKMLKTEDLEARFVPRPDKKAIFMEFGALEGVASLEYEVTYEAEVLEKGETLKVTRGVGPSTIELEAHEKKIRREILLGSCSRNVCKYDQGVEEVEFVIKVNYENGELGTFQEKVSL